MPFLTMGGRAVSHLSQAKCVICLTFDFDAESAEMRRSPHLPVKLSKGQFGPRVGLERVLAVLDKYAIRSTFFVPAWTAQKYEPSMRDILSRGHEVGAHGYLHENLGELKPEEEWRVMEKSVRLLENTVGVRPLGFRAPYWEWSLNTLGYLRRLNFMYDSSLMNDDKPYLIEVEGERTDTVELPVEWMLDDWPLFEVERRSPSEVFEIWSGEFEAVYQLGISYFMLTMHPECIGRASRIRMLESFVDRMSAQKGVVFARCVEVADHWRKVLS